MCIRDSDTTDGFEISRRDLELRGPGEFLGARQSGAALLRFADFETDGFLVEKAMAMADKWIREKQKHTYVRINENWKNCTFKYPGWIKD